MPAQPVLGQVRDLQELGEYELVLPHPHGDERDTEATAPRETLRVVRRGEAPASGGRQQRSRRSPDALKGRAKGPKNPNFLDKAPVNQKGQYKNSRNEQKAAAAALKGLSRKGKREAKQRALKIKAANDAACFKKSLADNAKAVKASGVAKPKKTISKEQAPDVVLYSTLYCIVNSHCIAL